MLVRDFLVEYNILFDTQGKNCTQGWYQIQCPFCGDHSKHLGISPTEFFHCWRCGMKGHVSKLIQELLQCSWGEANRTVERFKDLVREAPTRAGIPPLPLPRTEASSDNASGGRVNTPFTLPAVCTKKFPPSYRQYLRGRNFAPNVIISEFDLWSYPFYGKYKHRLIIPVHLNSVLVNFLAMDTTGRQEPKYQNCPNTEAVVTIKNCVYNIDNVSGDTLVLVEGVTDVWRMGKRIAAATLGIEFTIIQMKEIISRGFQKVFVMFDGEAVAQQRAMAVANHLSPFIPQVQVMELPEDMDPGMLTVEQRVMALEEMGIEYE